MFRRNTAARPIVVIDLDVAGTVSTDQTVPLQATGVRLRVLSGEVEVLSGSTRYPVYVGDTFTVTAAIKADTRLKGATA